MPPSPSCCAISTAPAMPAGRGRAAALAAALTELPALPGKTGRQRDDLAPLYP